MGRRSDIVLHRPGVMHDPPRRWYAILSAAMMMSLALAFFLSNADRLSAPAYAGVRETGGGLFWGAILLVAGLVTVGAVLRNSMRSAAHAMFFTGIVFLVLAGTFAVSAIRYDTANLIAPVVAGFIAFGHLDVARRMRWDYNDPDDDCDELEER